MKWEIHSAQSAQSIATVQIAARTYRFFEMIWLTNWQQMLPTNLSNCVHLVSLGIKGLVVLIILICDFC